MEKYSKEFIEKIYNDKIENKLTYRDIYNKYQINIEYWFKKYGFIKIKESNLDKRNKISELNWDGKEIKTEWQAYYIGLMMSDGYIIPANGMSSIKLVNKDGEFELLNYLQKCLIKHPKELMKEKNNYFFRIYSLKFMENIQKLGVLHNKTYCDLHIPNMPKELIRHFIRGYFDGDGTVFFDRKYLKSNICSISTSILEEIQKVLLENKIESAINIEIREGKTYKVPQGESSNCKNMYRLFVRKQASLEKFKHFLYDNATVCLIRKYKKFYLDDPELTKNCKKFNVVQRIEEENSSSTNT